MTALTLFDFEPPVVPAEDPVIDWIAAENIALLYTATERGNNSGIRFAMSIDDARAWCSHPTSAGVLHGTRWAYFFTSVATFVRCHWGPKNPRIVTKGIVDNGQWDDRIAALGLQKIGVSDFGKVLGPIGIEVVTS